MKKFASLLLLLMLLASCKSTRLGETDHVQLRFLDDHIIAGDLEVDGTLVGGLSGIDYHDGAYYLVVDHPGQPRLYKAEIDIRGERIHDIDITQAILIDTKAPELKDMHLDMEGIVYHPTHRFFYISSEGLISDGKDPAIFIVSQEGKFREHFNIPQNHLASSSAEPRNNGSFEGLSFSHDRNGIWAAMELPLSTDGPAPKLYPTDSPVRITYFDHRTKQPTRQFTYKLGRVRKFPWLYFAINGLTDILEYAPDRFLVLERAFSAGNGRNGNRIRIYDVDASMATNTLDRDGLKYNFHNPATKELVYDFKWAKKYLEEGIIDNVEGMALGPVLPNGNQSIILVADNNFNSMGKQYNQFILMEMKIDPGLSENSPQED